MSRWLLHVKCGEPVPLVRRAGNEIWHDCYLLGLPAARRITTEAATSARHGIVETPNRSPSWAGGTAAYSPAAVASLGQSSDKAQSTPRPCRDPDNTALAEFEPFS
jgi:hypothetical protein